ncbi:MAG: hypothetical protein WKG00_25620 [Polyangiaceae bacterium]
MSSVPSSRCGPLAVIATVLAFVLHLGLRGRTVDIGYKLGRERRSRRVCAN